MSNGNEINTITPFPLAMVVCDFVYHDPYTGKFTLIGTFSTITGTEFPLIHPLLFVYAALTGGRGKIPLRLEVVDADDDSEPLTALNGSIDSKSDPRGIQEIAFCLPGLQFPKPGEYRIALHANDEFMVERRLLVIAPQQGSKKARE